MKDVQVGDVVLTSSNEYQPVYALGHHAPNQWGMFYNIETQIPLESLKMTGEHLVHIQDHNHPVRVDSLQVGDILLMPGQAGNDGIPISAIRPFWSKGMFTPLIAGNKATLVVDGYQASSYIALQSDHPEYVTWPEGAASVFLPKWSHEEFVHWTLAPFRVLCNLVSSQYCHLRRIDNGIPPYINWGIGAVQWAHEQGGIVESIFLFFALLLFVACRLVEVIASLPLSMLGICGGGVALSVWMSRRQEQSKNNTKKTV